MKSLLKKIFITACQLFFVLLALSPNLQGLDPALLSSIATVDDEIQKVDTALRKIESDITVATTSYISTIFSSPVFGFPDNLIRDMPSSITATVSDVNCYHFQI